MRILGIDPGLATIGLGLIEAENSHNVSVIDWLTITTPAGLSLGQRLLEIQKDLDSFITESQPELIVIEKIYFATNKQTGIDVAQARGVIVLSAMKSGAEVLEATPLQLKSCITGDGAADKLQVQTMVQRTLKLNELPKPDDAADALALALYGAFTHKTSVIV
ncbi:MAG: crossover junction endodeoxyribonuclease RuvC [bacterium]|nr:crossover junction endodeoxyribonuclease RuvC [bacterium]